MLSVVAAQAFAQIHGTVFAKALDGLTGGRCTGSYQIFCPSTSRTLVCGILEVRRTTSAPLMA